MNWHQPGVPRVVGSGLGYIRIDMTCTARSQMLLRVMHGLACHTEGGGRTTSPSTSLRSIEQGLRQGGGWRRRLPPLRSIEAGGREGGGGGKGRGRREVKRGGGERGGGKEVGGSDRCVGIASYCALLRLIAPYCALLRFIARG